MKKTTSDQAQGDTAQTISPARLRAHSKDWESPTPDEIREVLAKAGLTGIEAANLLGVLDRQVRRWTAGDAPIPYAGWAILCYQAGFGCIWEL